MRALLSRIWTNDSSRSSKVIKNIVINFGVKGLSVIISFLLVRSTYDFLKDGETYGVWLTILSVLSWITLFDLGLGNGLRYRLAEKIALKEYVLGRKYVSTAYVVMTIIVIALLLIFLIVNPLLQWDNIFNISNGKFSIDISISIIIISYLFVFLFSLINSVAFANQNSFIPGLITLLTNIAIVILIYVFHLIGFSSLISLSIIFSMVSLLTLVISNIYIFKFKYTNIRPHYSYVDRSLVGEIFNVGIKFFILQIMAMVITMSSNMVILQTLGPQYVTEYQIVFKLFSVFTIIASLIMAPLWSAYTDAYTRKDYSWIRRTLNKLMLLMVPLVISIAGLIIIANPIIHVWMGTSFSISKSVFVLMGIYTALSIWNNIFAYLLNGINKTNVQLIALIIGGCINIPLGIYLAKNMHLGNSGIILATICSLSLFSVAGPIQVYFEFYSKKKSALMRNASVEEGGL
ncbi:lipopolysaccharide biosynthesis protein [Paenibacillus hexagrammi]|uniref:Polysaccharide biosynthesis protein n=1 Tax=Paenibacillus hexagrammi TaxID=2908839 RepID=A0ABY3SLP0_9BACL|nr:hypothetical protein [Paenibacillus sp. YPD9-1]UJF34320.1 hypothetical protein L0M14_03665 [Paenibacillus sp. YPD9-1]